MRLRSMLDSTYHAGRVNRWRRGVRPEDYQCIESSRWEPDWRILDTDKRIQQSDTTRADAG
jgi:hypothetical protein